MKRPFKDFRPFGPFVGENGDKDVSSAVEAVLGNETTQMESQKRPEYVNSSEISKDSRISSTIRSDR
jgi:hypothetical protein